LRRLVQVASHVAQQSIGRARRWRIRRHISGYSPPLNCLGCLPGEWRCAAPRRALRVPRSLSVLCEPAPRLERASVGRDRTMTAILKYQNAPANALEPRFPSMRRRQVRYLSVAPVERALSSPPIRRGKAATAERLPDVSIRTPDGASVRLPQSLRNRQRPPASALVDRAMSRGPLPQQRHSRERRTNPALQLDHG
jgi:hypothetical protein